jgi:hypothetical protein
MLAKISESYATRKESIELKNTGSLTDPEATNSEKVGEREAILFGPGGGAFLVGSPV